MAAFNCHMVVNQEFLPGVSYMYATGSSQTCKLYITHKLNMN